MRFPRKVGHGRVLFWYKKMMTKTQPLPNIKKRRHYDSEFKRDAVERVLRTGKSCADVASELGLNSNLLARWRREYLGNADQNHSSDSELKPSELAEELRRTRMQLDDMQMQRDILKKALNIVSQAPGSGGIS